MEQRARSSTSGRPFAPVQAAARASQSSCGSSANACWKPIEAQVPRMEQLARLPLFFALGGRRRVVAGGTAAAAWKAELLSTAGADVQVFCVEISDEMSARAGSSSNGTITLHRRSWRASDLVGAAIAIASFEDDQQRRIATAARAVSVPVNVIDKPAWCDFTFGSIVNRSPLVIVFRPTARRRHSHRHPRQARSD